jgi:hypothetical protein
LLLLLLLHDLELHRFQHVPQGWHQTKTRFMIFKRYVVASRVVMLVGGGAVLLLLFASNKTLVTSQPLGC